MYSFGPRSRRNLNQCHDDLQIVFNEVLTLIDCSVLVGFRPEAEQARAFSAGNSQLQWPHSKHNRSPSLAADVAPYPIIWEESDRVARTKVMGRFYLLGGIVICMAERLRLEGHITHRLRWGGDWDMDGDILDQRFDDLAHFELLAMN